MKNWETRQEIFRTMPLRSYLVFCLAVACTFAAVAVVNDLFDLERSNSFRLVVKILTTSGLSVLCVLFVQQRVPRKLIASIAVAYVVMLVVLSRLSGPIHTVLLTPQG
jgi:hypothetical protein